MQNILEQYFIEFGQLDLLHIGQLKFQQSESVVDGGILLKPSEAIVYEATHAIPSKHCYQYIAVMLDISYEQAVIQFEQFIHSNFNDENKEFAWPSIGKLIKMDTAYIWQSNFISSQYFTDLHFEKMPISNTSQNTSPVEKKEQWWIAAIVITLLCSIAILIKIYL